MDKHTATPWEVNGGLIFGVNDEPDKEGVREAIAKVGGVYNPAGGYKLEERNGNIQLILKAVNNYEPLVASLKLLLQQAMVKSDISDAGQAKRLHISVYQLLEIKKLLNQLQEV